MAKKDETSENEPTVAEEAEAQSTEKETTKKTKSTKKDKEDWVEQAFNVWEEGKGRRLYIVVDSSKKGKGSPIEDLYFLEKQEAKKHRNNLNANAKGDTFRYQVRKGPDHWKL